MYARSGCRNLAGLPNVERSSTYIRIAATERSRS
jgi:hypothetical protein